jgi:GR25 family glycosyltransferase involved in LPS biosynthesis
MKAFVINCKNSTDRLNLFRENNFPFDVERFNAIEGRTPAERDYMSGLSHLAIMNSQSEFPFLICEDDCILLQPWSLVEKAMKQLPDKWDALWLGATLHTPLEKYSENLYCLKNAHTLHAVIYNSGGMIDFMYKNFTPNKYRCLDVLTAYSVQHKFNCFTIYPIVATQRSCMSDINGKFLDNYNEIVNSYNKYIR